MAKKIKTIIKLNIKGAEANPAPPVGPALGQAGIGIMDFCKEFNERTKDKKGEICPAVITVYEDRTFTFILKTAPASSLILKAIGVEKGSKEPNKQKIGKLTKKQLEEIAQIKMVDLNARSIEAACKIVAGTARQMGVEVEN